MFPFSSIINTQKLEFLEQTSLLRIRSRCSRGKDARGLSDSLPDHSNSVVSWTFLISAYSRKRESSSECFRLFQQMLCAEVVPDKVTFIVMLKTCTVLQDVDVGRKVHFQIVERNLEKDGFVGNSMIDMYMKCGHIDEALHLFYKMRDNLVDDVVSWTSLIAGYVAVNLCEEAITRFQEMMVKGILPNQVTFVSMFTACGSVGSVERGKGVHLLLLNGGHFQFDKSRFRSLHMKNNPRNFDVKNNINVGNAIVDMYSKCGDIKHAHQMFSLMQERDVVSWTIIISGYAHQGLHEEAFFLFKQMQQQEGMKCDNVVFSTAIQVCTSLMFTEEGKQIHVYIVSRHCEPDALLLSSLICMYTECGNLILAWKVFDEIKEMNLNTPIWNTMIAGYASHGDCYIAQRLFENMQERCFLPDHVTILTMLKVNSNGSLHKQLHVRITGAGYKSQILLRNALIGTHFSSGFSYQAYDLFKKMQNRDVVSWNTIISGYAQLELFHEALVVFKEMQQEGPQPDSITLSSILKVCAAMAMLDYGMQAHNLILECSLDVDIYVKSALIDMYVKCGAMKEANYTFNYISGQNVASWNSIIGGYAQQGLSMDSLMLFDCMRNNMMPDLITFIVVLYACNHSGLVCEACHVFDLMSSLFGLTPTTDHYACVVDVLGRVGLLEEAVNAIRWMPIQPDAEVWISLLGACRNHGNAILDEYAFQHVVEIQCIYMALFPF